MKKFETATVPGSNSTASATSPGQKALLALACLLGLGCSPASIAVLALLSIVSVTGAEVPTDLEPLMAPKVAGVCDTCPIAGQMERNGQYVLEGALVPAYLLPKQLFTIAFTMIHNPKELEAFAQHHLGLGTDVAVLEAFQRATLLAESLNHESLDPADFVGDYGRMEAESQALQHRKAQRLSEVYWTFIKTARDRGTDTGMLEHYLEDAVRSGIALISDEPWMESDPLFEREAEFEQARRRIASTAGDTP